MTNHVTYSDKFRSTKNVDASISGNSNSRMGLPGLKRIDRRKKHLEKLERLRNTPAPGIRAWRSEP